MRKKKVAEKIMDLQNWARQELRELRGNKDGTGLC
jgi:hypothetical protein